MSSIESPLLARVEDIYGHKHVSDQITHHAGIPNNSYVPQCHLRWTLYKAMIILVYWSPIHYIILMSLNFVYLYMWLIHYMQKLDKTTMTLMLEPAFCATESWPKINTDSVIHMLIPTWTRFEGPVLHTQREGLCLTLMYSRMLSVVKWNWIWKISLLDFTAS